MPPLALLIAVVGYRRVYSLPCLQESDEVKEAVDNSLVKAVAEESSSSYTDILVKKSREDLQ